MRDTWTGKKNLKQKILMFGAGELGQEIFREARRFGSYYLVAVDRYQGTPAGRIADKEYTFKMLDGEAMRMVVEKEEPDIIIPEIEAIDTEILVTLEEEGWFIVPNATATKICMDRRLIRETIAEKAGLLTSRYEYATTADREEFADSVEKIGFPCLSKAIMSSSGRGTYLIRGKEDIEKARNFAIKDARGSGKEVIIEELIEFDTEVTELAIRHLNEDGKIVTSFTRPIGHYQIDGDYHSSWQSPRVEEYLPVAPEDMRTSTSKLEIEPELEIELLHELAKEAELRIYETAKKITETLGGLGVFGCELFVKVKDGKVLIYANECSPRPHDTGMVTYISHPPGLSEGGLHLRAISGRAIPSLYMADEEKRIIEPLYPAATHVLKAPIAVDGYSLEYRGIFEVERALGVEVYHFGKPFSYHEEDKDLGRVAEERMGVILARGSDALDAKERAEIAAHKILMRSRQCSEWKTQDETTDGRRKHLIS